MRLKATAQNWLERLALRLGFFPTPLVDTLQAMIMCRTIMAASRLGVFTALGTNRHTTADLAERIGADQLGLGKLLSALVSLGYVAHSNGQYWLMPVSRKWLLPSSATSMHDNMLFRYLEWQAVEHLEHYVATGEAVDAHDMMTTESWPVYQRGLAALARQSAAEVVRRFPRMQQVETMLDVGGAHGAYTAAFCHQFPKLQATVFDLPQAVDSALAVFREVQPETLARRVTYRGGNALTDDLGAEVWDLVLVSQLVHHFNAQENQELALRAQRSLRSGGVFAIIEPIRTDDLGHSNQLTQLLDLFFAVTSKAGTWSQGEIQSWQQAAGMKLLRSVRLRSMPGVVMVMARKP